METERDEIERRALEHVRRDIGGEIVGRKLLPISDHLTGMAARRDEHDFEGDGREWFVLQCHPQHEYVAHGFLTGRRFKVYFPSITCVTTRGVRRTKVEIERPMFPSYVFVWLNLIRDKDRLHTVRSAPGIHKFVQLDDGYAVVPTDDMTRVYHVEAQKRQERLQKAEWASQWEVGESARITEGPFCGLNCVITNVDTGERITVEVPFMKRAVPLHLKSSVLEKL